MATTTIASNEMIEPLIAPELNSNYYSLEHSTYKYQEITPDESGNFTSTSAGSGGTITFQIPSNVWNMSKSYLELDVSIAAPAAGTKQMIFADAGASMIQSVNVFHDGNIQLANILNVNRYMKATLRRETPIESAESMGSITEGVDTAIAVGNGVFEGLTTGKPVTTVSVMTSAADATLNTLFIGPGATTATIGATGFPGTVVGRHITSALEPEYVMSAITTASVAAYRMRFQLDTIKNSIFSKDQTIAWPKTIQIQFVIAPAAATYFNTTQTTTAIAGAVAAVAAAGDITLSNVRLQIATEDNILIRNRLKQESADGMNIMIDQVNTTVKAVTSTSTTHNVDVTIRKTDGKTLKRVYWYPFEAGSNNTPANGSANHSHYYAPSSIVTTAIWNAYLNSLPLYSKNINETVNGSWRLFRDSLRGSCIRNSDQYTRNFCYCYSFMDNYNATNRPMNPSPDKFVDGMPITADIIFGIRLDSTSGVANHYFFTITTKEFMIKDGGVSLLS